MGFTSQDDLINQITTNAKTGTVIYQKTITPDACSGHGDSRGIRRDIDGNGNGKTGRRNVRLCGRRVYRHRQP